MTIEIINLIEDPRWKKILCKCNNESIETKYPIAQCIHCESEAQEKMIPKEEYDFITEDEDGNKKTIHVKKIKLQYNEKYQNVIGWSHVG
jgi:hypothetical protein